jgi:signal transduction histidine kinase
VAAVPASWPRPARSAAPVLAVVYGICAVLVVAATRGPQDLGPSSYAGTSSVAYAADLVAGLSLLAAASLALLDHAAERVGLLALAAGVLWFAPEWEGWPGGPAAIRSLGSAAVPLLAVPLAYLAAARARRIVHLGVAVLVAAALARLLVRDPFLDANCWRDCLSRTFVVHADAGLARAFDRVWEVTTIALVVAVTVARVKSAAAMIALITVAVYAAELLRTPQENPADGMFSALFYGRAVALTGLAVGVVLAVLRIRHRRAAVSRLAQDLGAVPNALATAFGDPSLEVVYWLPDSGRYVDAAGLAVDPPTAASDRAVTPIVRHGKPVALVSHDGSVRAELGSAARLALENERLQAEVRAQLESLRRSRMRITERGDVERRTLERDLHDGAQQRLLALSFDLRLARAAADGRDAEVLEHAIAETQSAIEELRELAHGIYPAILVEAGLGPALATLADEAPIPVELDGPIERFGGPVESALYVAVREAVDDATRRRATWARVALHGRVELVVDDDGVRRAAPLLHLADRIGALGGETAFDGNTLRAEIPCG